MKKRTGLHVRSVPYLSLGNNLEPCGPTENRSDDFLYRLARGIQHSGILCRPERRYGTLGIPPVALFDVPRKGRETNINTLVLQLLMAPPGTLFRRRCQEHLEARICKYMCAHIAPIRDQPGGLQKAPLQTQKRVAHRLQARPSLISEVRKADLLICSGAQLEIGWLPLLLSKANNPRVLPGRDGFLEASSLVRRLDVPDSVDRAQGDMHPQGNPHIQMNPHNIALVAQALGQRMAQLAPEHAADFESGLAAFLQRWNTAIARWEERAAPLRGSRVVCHHKSWVYLEDWLGLNEVGTLEPK